MAIEIKFLANILGMLKGTKNMEDALGDVVDSLDDVAREAQAASKTAEREFDGVSGSLDDVARDAKDAAGKLESEFDSATKDVEGSTERLEKSFAELRDKAISNSKQAGDGMARSFGDGASKSKEEIKELGSEARANLAETAASFDGSAESIVDGVQGTFGGIVSSLGPVGAALGAAAAIGIGLWKSQVEEAGEDTEAFRERVSELATEFIETGSIGSTSLEFIIDRLKQLAAETDPAETNLADLQDTARRADSSFRDLAEAYAGNVEGLDELISKQENLRSELEQESTELDVTTQAGQTRYKQLLDQITAVDEYTGELKNARAAADEAAKSEAAWLAAGGPELEAKAAAIEAIDEAYDEAAGAAEDFIDEESGIFDVGGYIESMEARTKALQDYQENLAKSPLTTEAKQFLADQGVESAAQFLAGYQSATPAQQRALNDIWTEAGRASSGAYSGALSSAMPSTITGPRVLVQTPTIASILSGLQQQANRNPLRVTADVYTRAGTKVF